MKKQCKNCKKLRKELDEAYKKLTEEILAHERDLAVLCEYRSIVEQNKS